MKKKFINTVKYEQAKSANNQNRIQYCTLISSFKGPVFLVVWVTGHNGTFALVEVDFQLETLIWIKALVPAEVSAFAPSSIDGCSGKGCESDGTGG